MARVRTYLALRGVISAHGMTNSDVAAKLQLTPFSISNRFCGRNPWDINEMYQIMDMFHLPYDQLHIYFPPNGIAQSEGSVT